MHMLQTQRRHMAMLKLWEKMTENVNIGNLQDFWQFFYPLCPCSTLKFHMHHVKISKELSSEMRQE